MLWTNSLGIRANLKQKDGLNESIFIFSCFIIIIICLSVCVLGEANGKESEQDSF